MAEESKPVEGQRMDTGGQQFIVIYCPTCRRKDTVRQPGEHHCTCGQKLDVRG